MTIEARLTGRDGSIVRVTPEGALSVVQHNHPVRDQDAPFPIPVVQGFADAAGSEDMVIDGATTPTHFYVQAQTDFDVYIRRVQFVVADVNAVLNEFGNIGVLGTGVDFSWISSNLGSQTIAILKTNWDFIKMCGATPPIGATTSAFRASNVSGSAEGYIPNLDLVNTFGMPFGIRLRKGTLDRLDLFVQDDLAGVNEFSAVAYGLKI